MNIILLNNADFISPDLVRLHGRRFHHVRDILGATTGQSLRVGLVNGPIGTARILGIQHNSIDLQVSLKDNPAPPLPITLILALPRPKVFRRILQGVIAMGVKRIVLFNTWRVEKSYWQSPLLCSEAIHEQLLLGLEQSGDTILPVVLLEPRFKPFVEDSLPAMIAGTRAFIAHPADGAPCPTNIVQPVTLAIGPEGGFIPYEVAMLVAAGFTPIHLGRRPLRVETVVPALLGRIMPCIL